MTELTRDQLINALKTVIEPEMERDVVSLGLVDKASADADKITIILNLTTPNSPLKPTLEEAVRTALEPLRSERDLNVNFSCNVSGASKDGLPGIKNVIAVGSGKGGVGKSTVAANLAASLAAEGAAVGLLDADIYGPSQAKMFSVDGKRLMADEEKNIIPLKSFGVKLMSIANLVEDGQALTWRGPILHGTLTQMLKQTLWGELDYLLVDLPPGTGDVQLSLSQLVSVSGAVIVTTPQEVALLDVRRAFTMLRKTHIPVLGIIENMSYYQLPDGSRDPIFGEGGATAFAEAEDLRLLGQIPITRATRESGDSGQPLVLSQPESPSARAFRRAARVLVGSVNLQNKMSLPVL